MHPLSFTIEAADPAAAAAFWATLLGGELTKSRAGDVRLRGPFPDMTFRREGTAKTVKNRVHLDVYVSAVEPLLQLGAEIIAAYPDESRTTLSDGEGNEFCAFTDPDLPVEPMARVFSVCTDSSQPETIAAWWAARTGARIGPGADGTPRWLYGAAGLGTLVWKFIRVDDARVVPNRWRWQLGDTAELDSAGATLVEPDVMVDPDGNEFGAT